MESHVRVSTSAGLSQTSQLNHSTRKGQENARYNWLNNVADEKN